MQQYTGNTMGSKSKIPRYISPFIKFPDFALKIAILFQIPRFFQNYNYISIFPV